LTGNSLTRKSTENLRTEKMCQKIDTEKMLAENLEMWNAADPTVKYSKETMFIGFDEQTEWENRYGTPWWQ